MARCEKTDCWAHLTWHCEHAGLCRVFGGCDEFWAPYCIALPFKVAERFAKPEPSGKVGLVEFMGLTEKMLPCQYRAMWAAITAAGFGVLVTRSKHGTIRTIELRSGYWKKRS